VALVAAGMREFYPIAFLALCAFVAGSIALEYGRGIRARMRRGENGLRAFFELVRRNQRRYGGYVVHLGMMVLFIGITASQAFQTESTATIAEGESFELDGYSLQFAGLESVTTPNMDQVTATLNVSVDGRVVDTLRPERRFYRRPDQVTSEVDRHTPLSGDLYLVFVDYDPDGGSAIFKAYHNPLVKFVWIGWMVVIFGTGVAVLPEWQRVAVPAPGLAYEEARAAGPV